MKQSNVTNIQTINIDLITGTNYTNIQTFHGSVNNTTVTNHQNIDNKSSQSMHCFIPTDIDGIKYYKVNTSIKTWHKDTSDLHYFILKTTTKAGLYGNTIKTGSCYGSWICPNKSCPCPGTSHELQPIKVNRRADPIHKGVQICEICDTYAVGEGCDTRKFVQFAPKSQVAIVYHLGEHTCWNKIDKQEAKLLHREKAQSETRTGSAKDVAVEDLCDKITAGDIEGAENDAEKWTNYRLTKPILMKLITVFGNVH